MDNITTLSATALAEHIRAGEVSAVEVIEAHIRRIEEVDDKLNAVVIRLFDEARAQAAEADKRRARGEPLGRLHGVPVTIKEQYRVAGTQVTLGALNKVGNVYDDEGPLVTKLRQEGAIILGKTNIIQTLAAFESDNRVYGRTNNPWNLDRSSGGSTGGEGAIIAAYGSPLGLGGDYGGSIRIPSHFCGIHGLKPTSGRLSNADFPSDLFGNGQESVIPQPGPMARTVTDLELAMRIFAETSQETTPDMVPPVPWPDFRQVDVSKLRVGYYTDNGYFPASPALRRAVEEAAAALASMGASVIPITPPDTMEGVRLFLASVTAGGVGEFKRLLGNEKPLPQVAGMIQGGSMPALARCFVLGLMRARGQRYIAHTIEYSGPRSAEEYFAIVEDRTKYRHRFVCSLDEAGIDAVLCPPCALPAVLHGTAGKLFPAMSYCVVYNVIGAPAGVVAATRVRPGEESDRPVGRDIAEITAQEVEKGSAGMPVGVQVVARHWREDIVLAVMAALETHFRAQPDYPALRAIAA